MQSDPVQDYRDIASDLSYGDREEAAKWARSLQAYLDGGNPCPPEFTIEQARLRIAEGLAGAPLARTTQAEQARNYQPRVRYFDDDAEYERVGAMTQAALAWLDTQS